MSAQIDIPQAKFEKMLKDTLQEFVKQDEDVKSLLDSTLKDALKDVFQELETAKEAAKTEIKQKINSFFDQHRQEIVETAAHMIVDRLFYDTRGSPSLFREEVVVAAASKIDFSVVPE